MRLSLLAALSILCAASVVPTAAAAPTSLAFEAPASTPGNITVPVNITLTISQFMCHEPHAVTVHLGTGSTDGVKATFERTAIAFSLPADSYFTSSYSQTQTVNLTVRAITSGQVDLTATFAADVGPCFVPGGFDPATASASIAVEGPRAPEPAPTNTTNETTTPVANETNTTPANTTRPKPTPRQSTAPACGPEGGCGPIGEYAPAEIGAADTPGVGFLLMLAMLGVAALVARRRNK